MKKNVILFALFVLVFAAQAVDSFHVFTSTDGRLFKAMVLSLDAVEGRVDVLQDDNSVVCMNIDAFSEADQAYLAQWEMCSNFMSPTKFAVIPSRSIIQDRRVGSGSTDQVTRYRYELDMINHSTGPMENLIVEYLVFYTHEATGAGKDEKVVQGQIPVGRIGAGGWKSLSMDSLAIMERCGDEQLKASLADSVGNQSHMWIRLSMDAPDGQQVERIFSLPHSGAVTHAAWLSCAKTDAGAGTSET